jgi:hypothetical protein
MQARMVLKATLFMTRNNVNSIDMYLADIHLNYNHCGVKYPMQ